MREAFISISLSLTLSAELHLPLLTKLRRHSIQFAIHASEVSTEIDYHWRSVLANGLISRLVLFDLYSL